MVMLIMCEFLEHGAWVFARFWKMERLVLCAFLGHVALGYVCVPVTWNVSDLCAFLEQRIWIIKIKKTSFHTIKKERTNV